MTVYKNGKLWLAPTIQRGVPIPPERKQLSSGFYITAKAMEVGDCIDIPYSRTGVASNLSRALGHTFTQRKVGDKLRIWRTE